MEKQRKTKALIIIMLLVVITGLTVAFAALSTTLSINGTAYLDAAKWGIRFENLSSPTIIGKATTTGTAKIEETKAAEITDMNVNLSTPGDKVVYTADLVNNGTINAKIDNIEKTVLTSEQQRYLIFKVTDKNGREISKGDILSAGETKKITITIEFIKDLTKEDLPTSTSTISLLYKLNFVQTDEKNSSGNQEPSTQACTSFDKKDTYNVGDVVALCNTNTGKSEDFYVIKDNGDTVTAFAKYNLLIGDAVELNWNTMETINSTPISTSEEEYGLQSSIAANYEWDSNGHPKSKIIKSGINFANDEESKKMSNCSDPFGCYYGYWTDNTSNHNLSSKYGTSYPADVFDSNSNLYTPLENYKAYIKNTLGKESVKTKLISLEDLINLGCVKNYPRPGINSDCEAAPSWVYSVNYWTATAGDNSSVWMISSYGGLASNTFEFPGSFGLRPVITISKSEL